MLVCRSLVCLLVFGFAISAAATPRRIALVPAGTEVNIRTYGLGMLPLDGHFTRFDGWLTYDPDDRSICRVDLSVDVASLAMPDSATRDTIVGADFMDASRFPSLTFGGACQPSGLDGLLGMHGITRPLTLSVTWKPGQVVAEGRLRRADWGMTAMPFLAGQTVRILVSVSLTARTHASQN